MPETLPARKCGSTARKVSARPPLLNSKSPKDLRAQERKEPLRAQGTLSCPVFLGNKLQPLELNYANPAVPRPSKGALSRVGGRCTGGSRGQGWRPQSGKVAPSLPGKNPGLLLCLLRRHQSPRQPNRPPPGLNSPTSSRGFSPGEEISGWSVYPVHRLGGRTRSAPGTRDVRLLLPPARTLTPRSRLRRQNSTKVPTASSREPAPSATTPAAPPAPRRALTGSDEHTPRS